MRGRIGVRRDFLDELGAAARKAAVNRTEELQQRLLQLVEEQRAISRELGESIAALKGSPRRQKRRLGCTIVPSSNGEELTLRFRLVLPDGQVVRCREKTGLPVTPKNRAKLSEMARWIGEELRSGRFKYEEWFPRSAAVKAERARQLELGPWPRRRSLVPRAVSYAERYVQWIESVRSRRDANPPEVRPSLVRLYESDFKHHILPALGALRWSADEPSSARLERFRELLRKKITRRGKPMHGKTIRNVIDSSLRAFVRDAIRDGLAATMGGFEAMRWPHYEPPEPTPFAEPERDRLLEYLRAREYVIGGFGGERRAHYPFFAYAYTLFHSPLRPSEAAALKLSAVDLGSAVPGIAIRESRHRGYDSGALGPKNRSSRRIVKITPEHVEVLRPLIPLRPDPKAYLFAGLDGGPIKPENFYGIFTDAQRALGMTPIRDLYSTKDTYVSLARKKRVNDAWLERQTGVDIVTLKKHYGQADHDEAWDRAELEKIRPRKPAKIAPRRRIRRDLSA